MALILMAIDPDTNSDQCPAVFVDDESGDLLVQGWTVTDQRVLAKVDEQSQIAETESVVRLPARMWAIIQEALNGQGTTVR